MEKSNSCITHEFEVHDFRNWLCVSRVHKSIGLKRRASNSILPRFALAQLLWASIFVCYIFEFDLQYLPKIMSPQRCSFGFAGLFVVWQRHKKTYEYNTNADAQTKNAVKDIRTKAHYLTDFNFFSFSFSLFLSLRSWPRHALLDDITTRKFTSGKIECNEPIEVVSYKIGVCKVSAKGKDCTTVFQKLGFNGKTSVVLCKPKTGRMHQIRVHLQFLGK